MSGKSSISRWRRSQSERPRPKRAKVYLELTHLETRWLLSTGPGIVEYATTSSVSQPIAATAGADGNLWVTEYSAKELAAFTPTGAFAKSIAVSGMPYGITSSTNGTLWFTENGTTPYIGEVATSGSGLTQFALPAGANPQGITVGPDGNIWFVEYGPSAVGKITPGGSITTYSLSAGSRPVSITTGSDGNLWATESVGDRVARITPAGVITEFAVPTASALPWGITAGTEGNLWFTENGSGKIGRITTSGVITEYSLGSCCGQRPFGIVADSSDGNVWFTESGTSELGRITTQGMMTQYALPTTSASPYGITVGAGGSLWWTEATVGKIGTLPWLAGGQSVSTDPQDTQFNSFAAGNIALQNGDLQTSIPLDPSVPCGSCTGAAGYGDDSSAGLQTNLSLTYNSDTVDVQPIIDTTYQSAPSGPVPIQIQVQLTWNGTTQPPVTFSTAGHSPGDVYQLNTQVASPVTATGVYSWTVTIQATLPGGNIIQSTISGTAPVVVAGSTDPIGRGWNVGGTVQLMPDGNGGYIWVDGNGGMRDFEAGNGRIFVSPPNDLGMLLKNSNGTFTYTNPQEEQWNFNSSGKLTSITDPDGPSESFTYNASGDLTGVTVPGGWTTTFTYNASNELAAVDEPGGRVITVMHDSSDDLITATLPDGSVQSFTYNSAAQMLSDSLGTESTSYTYDPQGALASATNGPGRTMGLIPSSVAGLQTTPALSANQDVATSTDPLGRVTTYTLDSLGEPTKIQTPDGGTQTYKYDFAGQPTAYTDELGRVTTYTYQYGAGDGELTQVTDPNGGTYRYQYNPTFHEVTQEIDPLGRVTTSIYNAQGDLTETIDPMGRVMTEVWSNGLLQSETDPLGRTTTFAYNSQREETEQIDPLGRVSTYTYDSADNQIAVEDPMGRVTTSVYNGMREVVEQIDPMGRITTTLYDADGDVTETIDPLGRITTTLYDAQGEVTETIDPMGRITTTLYDADGELTETIDPMGRITTTLYDAHGEVTESIDPMGRITTTLYDLDGEVTESIDPLGRITTTLYDAQGELTETIDPMGRITTTLYDLDGEATETIDPMGRITTTLYDLDGEVTESIDPMGRISTTLYDADGEITESIDPMGRITTTLYDPDGEVTESIDPMGRISTMLYDADGEVTETIDPLGHMTTTLYDADGEVTETIDPLGHMTTTLYDADGEVTETIDPLGHATTTLYDADGEVTETIYPMGRISTTLYDADGEVTESIDPMGRITTTLYDADGEVTESIDPMGRITTVIYDADGEVTESIDPLGHATTALYDADGEVTESIDPMGRITTTVYDADGEVTETIDPLGNVTTTLYDADGEVTESIDSLGHMSTALYDADGEVTETIDPLGRATTSLYDSDGRLVSQTWFNASDVVVNIESFTYDADGNTLTAQDDNGTYTMTYDALNRLISVLEPLGAALTYTFDADGNRIETQDSQGGVTTYVYDADNELVSEQFGGAGETPLRIDLSFDADGEVLTETRYSNLAGTQVVGTTSSTYDSDGEVTSILNEDGSGTTVADFTYAYDAGGRVTSETGLGVTTTYTYDADSELSSESSSLATIDYTYDANGNRTGAGIVIGPGNQLLSDGTWNYTYDADDNLIKKVGVSGGTDAGLTWTYMYDNRNQMTSAVETQGSTTLETATYRYDVFGNRIEADVNNGSGLQISRFAYDGTNIWADLDGFNNLVTRRLYIGPMEAPVARISNSGTAAWYLTDRLGTVRGLTDNSGAVIDAINFDAFGNILTQTNTSASDRYLWTGQQFDSVTGLQFNRARYYDPAIGRWTTEDPLGFAAGDTNLYRYVGNDPVNRTDPSGLADLAIPELCPPRRRSAFPNKQSVEQLIKDLESTSFPTRDNASNALDRLIVEDRTGTVEYSLKQRLTEKTTLSLDLRLRIEGILNRFTRPVKARAIQTIDSIIEKYADKPPGAVDEAIPGLYKARFEDEYAQYKIVLEEWIKDDSTSIFPADSPAGQRAFRQKNLAKRILNKLSDYEQRGGR